MGVVAFLLGLGADGADVCVRLCLGNVFVGFPGDIQVNDMQIMRSQKAEPVLGPHQLHVLAVLREVVAISKAESQSARWHVGGNSNEPQQPKKAGNTRHDEDGYRALMGYV